MKKKYKVAVHEWATIGLYLGDVYGDTLEEIEKATDKLIKEEGGIDTCCQCPGVEDSGCNVYELTQEDLDKDHLNDDEEKENA